MTNVQALLNIDVERGMNVTALVVLGERTAADEFGFGTSHDVQVLVYPLGPTITSHRQSSSSAMSPSFFQSTSRCSLATSPLTSLYVPLFKSSRQYHFCPSGPWRYFTRRNFLTRSD